MDDQKEQDFIKDPPIIRVHSHVEMASLEEKHAPEREKDDQGIEQSFYDSTPKFSSDNPVLKVPRNSVIGSISIVFCAKINILMPFGILAIVVDKLYWRHGWVFLFNLLGIIPLAERLGYATEQLAFFTGPIVGDLLNATFGNATEVIISIHALRSKMILVVQQSLLGSILSNMLLALGCAFFIGGLVVFKREQVFNKEDSRTWSAEEEEAPEISKWEAITWLFVLTIWISFLSDHLVDATQGPSTTWKIPVAFISIVLLPIVGNAAEHAGAVMFAVKDKLKFLSCCCDQKNFVLKDIVW